jgi:pyruvate dehydrogenase E2 component (dihydrolipoamide acetyltransferase)
MPALGVAQQTGTLLKWLKSEGQSVAKGEPLMEIETDKATVEIEATASGILAAVTAKAGDEVPVGQKIAVILAPGEALPAESPHPVSPPLPPGEGRGDGRTTPAASAQRIQVAAPAARPGKILASPKARGIAKEQGIDLRSLRGSGPEGSILAADVLRAAGAMERQTTAVARPGGVAPPSSMRRIVGERMTRSKQNAPHFYLTMDIDMTATSRLRSEWKARGETAAPSLNDFILHAAARALKDFPGVNSTYTDLGIQQHAEINIGLAVALDEGLVVPVVRNADRLGLSELAARTRELIEKAQSKKLLPPDFEGGTFTISNLGMLGVDSFIAIINPPQCAILAVGRIAPRVVVEDGMFAIKSMMTATLSADHRIIDGAVGARFLQQFKRYLEAAEF